MRPSQLRNAFNRTASTYNWLTGMNPGYMSDLQASARYLRGTKILDLCCGTGLSTMAIATNMPEGADIVGLDMAWSMLRVARATVRPPFDRRITWQVGDATRPPTGETYDSVFMAYGLRNFPEAERRSALQRIRAIIQPNGVLVVQDYSLRNSAMAKLLWTLTCWLIIIPLGFIANRGDVGLYTYLWRSVMGFLPPQQVVDLLKEAGFTVLNAHPTPSAVNGPFTWVFVAQAHSPTPPPTELSNE